MSTADTTGCARDLAASFRPKLLGYSVAWQVYRTPSGDAQISVQLGTAAPLLSTVRMAVAGLDAATASLNDPAAAECGRTKGARTVMTGGSSKSSD